MHAGNDHFPDQSSFKVMLRRLLGPELGYYRLILLYSAAISLLSLALPVSVQILIDTLANIGQPAVVISIAVLTFALLVASGLLYALRAWAMEYFNRHIYSRLTSEIALTGLMANIGYFEEESRAALFNRYFDIMTLKKNVPYLLSYGFTLLFQAVIGFIVVSLYHFYFFIFSLLLVLLLVLTWSIFGWKAVSTGFRVSESKHEAASWLQGLAINNGWFKPRRRLQFALEHTNALVHAHLDAQQHHFRYSFTQLLIYLTLYALASATLLGIGGYLVIQGQLTLGQLVAAELILSSIFYGLPQLAGYLEYYYDVCAATEELHRFSQVPTEPGSPEQAVVFPPACSLILSQLHFESEQERGKFDFSLPAQSVVRITDHDGKGQDSLISLLKRSTPVQSGTMCWGSEDLLDAPATDVRALVSVLDRPTLLPLTIKQYLQLAAGEISGHRIQEVLSLLQLQELVQSLPAGINTLLSHSGRPLLLDEALRLKLAFTLLSDSRILVMTEIFDCVAATVLESFVHEYRKERQGIVLYFTHRKDLNVFSHRLRLLSHEQVVLTEEVA